MSPLEQLMVGFSSRSTFTNRGLAQSMRHAEEQSNYALDREACRLDAESFIRRFNPSASPLD